MRRASRLASAPPRSVAARAVAVAFAQSMAAVPGSAAALQPATQQPMSLVGSSSSSLTQRRAYHISMALADVEEADDDQEPLPEHPLSGKAFAGEVSAWHFVDRRGSITVSALDDAARADNGGSAEFTIKTAGAFESLMPTAHRDLVGTKVKFVVGFHGEATQVIIDASSLKRPADQVRAPPVLGKRDIRTEAVSNESYAELRKKAEDEKARRLEERKSGSVTITGASARVVCPAVMSGKIANWSKIHRTGLVIVEREGEVALHYVVQSAHDFVDATPSSLNLVGATVEFRPVHTHRIANATEVHEATLAQMGSGASAEGKEAARRDEATRGMAPSSSSLPMNVSLGECTNMVAEDIRVLEFPVPVSEEEKAEAAKAAEEFADVNETLLEDEGPHFGVITRWSGGQGTLESGDARVFFIDGVASFASFDPNQSSIRGAVVQFEQDTRSPRYAHSIVILSEVSSSGGVSDSNSTLPSQQYSLNVIDTKDFDARVLSDVDYSEAVEDSNVDGATIEGPAETNPDAPLSKLPMWGKRQPVKSTSSSNADMVRSDAGTVRTTPKKTSSSSGAHASAAAPAATTTAVPASGTGAGSDDDPFAHLPVQRGTLSTFSKRESTGIVVDDETGSRYVLRDASKDVVGYRARAVQDAFEKGCAVSFVAVGVSGRVATRVRIEKTRKGDEFDTERKIALEEKRAAEDKADKASASGGNAVDEDGNTVTASGEAVADDETKGTEIATENDEAVASPVAKDYWLRRFERVGANMTEYRKQVESLKPPEPDDQLDDYCADDPWFKDPQRNKKVRGEATVGDMFKIAPANLMHLAMQGAQDPAKIHKDAKKLEKRLPDEYRMKAREEAKRAAPEFLKAMQQTRERSGEKAFNFYT